jgi:hypothetical protein
MTSPAGWTDNHIALKSLKDVYRPQTGPSDTSDAKHIVLGDHGSHAQAEVFSTTSPTIRSRTCIQDEGMAMWFLNNVYCCYLPLHRSPIGELFRRVSRSKISYRRYVSTDPWTLKYNMPHPNQEGKVILTIQADSESSIWRDGESTAC